MGRVLFVLACLALAQILLPEAVAVRSDCSELSPATALVRTGDESRGLAAVVSRHTIADPPASGGATESSSEGEAGEPSVAEAPEIRRLGKHRSSDKSVAGGGVIIGGLVTAIFAAVYCYIRVTRRREGDKN